MPSDQTTDSRSLAREATFQILYAISVGHQAVETAKEAILCRYRFGERGLEFIQKLVQGVVDQKAALDSIIEPKLAHGWSLQRIAFTDQIALRMAVFELYHMPGIPPKATITEAVELAKKFGSAESGGFVNGLLASVLIESPKNEWDPSNEEKFPEPSTKLDPDPTPEEDDAATVEESDIKAGSWVISRPEND